MNKKEVAEKNLITSRHNDARISPRKVRTIANFIRGKNLEEAIAFLNENDRKASGLILKVVKSAFSNAVNKNMTNDEKLFYIHDIKLGVGPTLKRGRFGGRGKFKAIMKRSTHINVFIGLLEVPKDEQKS